MRSFYFFSFSSFPYEDFRFTIHLDSNIQGLVNLPPVFFYPWVTRSG